MYQKLSIWRRHNSEINPTMKSQETAQFEKRILIYTKEFLDILTATVITVKENSDKSLSLLPQKCTKLMRTIFTQRYCHYNKERLSSSHVHFPEFHHKIMLKAVSK